MSYPEYLKKNIFDVAKMPSTSFSNEGVSIPYRFDIKHGGLMNYNRSHYPYSIGRISGAGGLKSTVRDLRNLFNTLKNTEDFLDIPHKNLLFAPLVRKGGSEYTSLGLTISYDQTLNYGHNGTGVGNSAELRYFPKSDLLLIVLCNNRSGAQNLYSFFKNNLPISN
jgi:CubicO group peptidase (beta-lactamase class C family)